MGSNPVEFDFDEVQRVTDLCRTPWQAGILASLLDGPKRYTELGRCLAAWSRTRPSDSAITRTTKQLMSAGYLERVSVPGRSEKPYGLTEAGRVRAAEVAALVESLRKT